MNNPLAAPQPDFSIITIVYNNATHLGQCMESVLNQTYQNFEYIIIDGGSTDGTIDIIKTYEPYLAYWVSEKDNGISDAFNKGIAKARGKIVGLINSDDWLENDCLENLQPFLENEGIAYGSIWKIYGQSKLENGANHHRLKYWMSLNHPATFVSRSVYEQLGAYNNDYKVAMDYEFLLRCFTHQVSFFAINKILANMRMDGKSDVNWIQGFREVRRAKNLAFPKRRILHQLHFFYQIAATTISRKLRPFRDQPRPA